MCGYEHCQTEITQKPKGRHRKFCSNTCRVKAAKKRQAQDARAYRELKALLGPR